MATVITSTLKASGGDYSTIQDWIDDLLVNTPDFVASDIIPRLEIQYAGVLQDNFIDFKSGFTTDEDHYFELTVAEDFRHNWVQGGGFSIHNDSSSSFLFVARNHHLKIDWFEISGEAGQNQVVYQSANTAIDNTLIHDIGREISDTGATVNNSIIYNIRDKFILDGGIVTNCTVYAPEPSGDFDGDRIFRQCHCENVYLYHNHTKVTLDAFYLCTGDYNAALAQTSGVPGNNSVTILDDSDLVDPDNFDFRIKSTSSLATAGSDGGRIGAYYEESANGETYDGIAENNTANLYSVGATASTESVSIAVDQIVSVYAKDAIANKIFNSIASNALVSEYTYSNLSFKSSQAFTGSGQSTPFTQAYTISASEYLIAKQNNIKAYSGLTTALSFSIASTKEGLIGSYSLTGGYNKTAKGNSRYQQSTPYAVASTSSSKSELIALSNYIGAYAVSSASSKQSTASSASNNTQPQSEMYIIYDGFMLDLIGVNIFTISTTNAYGVNSNSSVYNCINKTDKYNITR